MEIADPHAAFCPSCGVSLPPGDALESGVLGPLPARPIPSRTGFRWKQVSEREKWIMTWGVTWRQWVAGLVIWVALFIVFLLFAAALGGLSEL